MTALGTKAGMTIPEGRAMALTIVDADIRDHPAAQLDLIEPGLTLVDSEFYLPNARGRRAFSISSRVIPKANWSLAS